MNHINLNNKIIGIWGFGIVGKSILNFIKPHAKQIFILDQKQPVDLENNEKISFILQTPDSIEPFLQSNDIIIASPGIVLANWKQYHHKFMHELDLFAQNTQSKSIIAITGTLGKTTVTSMLAQMIPQAIAAGNIGNAMLNVCDQKNMIVLELSSYQLQYQTQFSPNLAIWTNFYPNHLDHHQTEEEYFQAKCNILKFQKSNQTALVACNLIEKIKQRITLSSQIFLQCASNDCCKNNQYPRFFLNDNQLILQHNNKKTVIFSHNSDLPKTIFKQNWTTILTALHLQGFDQKFIQEKISQIKPEPHRMELVYNKNGLIIINDSKSTIWQASRAALDQFPHKKIALFLGGISKGTDRSPLIASLKDQSITVFAFGSEGEALHQMCQNQGVPCFSSKTLPEALNQFQQQKQAFEILLFSPAGASFDLFKNFQDRGNQFKKLIISMYP